MVGDISAHLRVTAVGLGLETLGIGLWLEALDDQPEWQRQFEECSGDQENDADGDPEDLGDGARRVNRVADHAQARQPSGISRVRNSSEHRNMAPNASDIWPIW